MWLVPIFICILVCEKCRLKLLFFLFFIIHSSSKPAYSRAQGHGEVVFISQKTGIAVFCLQDSTSTYQVETVCFSLTQKLVCNVHHVVCCWESMLMSTIDVSISLF